jgi:hypothetical protein
MFHSFISCRILFVEDGSTATGKWASLLPGKPRFLKLYHVVPSDTCLGNFLAQSDAFIWNLNFLGFQFPLRVTRFDLMPI